MFRGKTLFILGEADPAVGSGGGRSGFIPTFVVSSVIKEGIRALRKSRKGGPGSRSMAMVGIAKICAGVIVGLLILVVLAGGVYLVTHWPGGLQLDLRG